MKQLTLIFVLAIMFVPSFATSPAEVNAEQATRADVVHDFDACAMCELISAKYARFEKDNPGYVIPGMAFEVFEPLCDEMPRSIILNCEAFVSENLEDMVNFVEGDRMDPDHPPPLMQNMCTEIKQCHDKYDEFGQCVMCEWAMQDLAHRLDVNYQDRIANTTTEHEVVASLAGIKNAFPLTMKTEYSKFLQSSGPDIIKSLLGGMEIKQICSDHMICDKYFRMAFIGGNYCVPCQWVWKQNWKDFVDNAVTHGILSDTCDKMPMTMQKDCQHFVEKYATKVMEVAVKSDKNLSAIDSFSVCVSSRACADMAGNQNPECMYCDWLSQWIHMRKGDPIELIDMESACGLELPPEHHIPCKDFVHVHGNEIKAAEADTPPESPLDGLDFCTKLAICPESRETPTAIVDDDEDDSRASECAMCHWVLNEYKDDKDDTREDSDYHIQEMFIQACHRLPESLHGDCFHWVRNYADEISSYNPATRSADSFCELVDMCVRTS